MKSINIVGIVIRNVFYLTIGISALIKQFMIQRVNFLNLTV